MQEEINARPMVDVLSELTKRDVVMSGNQYVYLDTKKSVEVNILEQAKTKHKEEEELLLSTQYIRDRKAEYDKLNQDEMRFDDAINGTTTWIDAILAIKAKYPKG